MKIAAIIGVRHSLSNRLLFSRTILNYNNNIVAGSPTDTEAIIHTVQH